MDKATKNDLISNTINFITDYTKIIASFLENISGKNLSSKYRLSTEFILEVLNRFNSNSIVVSNLLSQYNKNATLIHPIGLLIRSSLLDFIMLMYLNSQNNGEIINNKEWVEFQLKNIYCNQLEHTQKDFNNFKKINENYNVTQLNDLLVEKFPDYFINSTCKLKNHTSISIINMILAMKNNPYTKSFVGVYERWSLYSKYEHYGALTYEMQRIKEINILSDICISILVVLNGITNCFNMLPQMNDKIIVDNVIKVNLELIKKQCVKYFLENGILKTE